jgi:hypothetical protein
MMRVGELEVTSDPYEEAVLAVGNEAAFSDLVGISSDDTDDNWATGIGTPRPHLIQLLLTSENSPNHDDSIPTRLVLDDWEQAHQIGFLVSRAGQTTVVKGDILKLTQVKGPFLPMGSYVRSLLIVSFIAVGIVAVMRTNPQRA